MRYVVSAILGVLALLFAVYGVSMLAELWGYQDNATSTILEVGLSALALALLSGYGAFRSLR
jgi:hypothetical protein